MPRRECARWQWSTLRDQSHWRAEAFIPAATRRQLIATKWTVRRSGAANAVGEVTLSIADVRAIVRNRTLAQKDVLRRIPYQARKAVEVLSLGWEDQPRRSLVVVTSKDASSKNIWHRMTALFSAWLASRAAETQLGADLGELFAFRPPPATGLHADFGFLFQRVVRPRRPSQSMRFGYVLVAPPDGFLWDLAWDHNLRCNNGSEIWTSFVLDLRRGMHLQPHVHSSPVAMRPHVCLMRRYAHRRLGPRQLKVVHSAARRVAANQTSVAANQTSVAANQTSVVANRTSFSHEMPVEELDFRNGSLREHAARAGACDLMLGMHGAAMIHSMWMRPGSAVVELMPVDMMPPVIKRPPQYYRHIAMMSRHEYHAIKASTTVEKLGALLARLARARNFGHNLSTAVLAGHAPPPSPPPPSRSKSTRKATSSTWGSRIAATVLDRL